MEREIYDRPHFAVVDRRREIFYGSIPDFIGASFTPLFLLFCEIARAATHGARERRLTRESLFRGPRDVTRERSRSELLAGAR